MSGDVCETCGHDWGRHGPEAGGCIECPCWLPGDAARPAAGDTRACGCRPAECEYCTDCDPDAFAGDTRTDRERLREAVASGLWDWRRIWIGDLDPNVIADAVLAIPEVAALLDAAEKWHEHERGLDDYAAEMNRISRALNGDAS